MEPQVALHSVPSRENIWRLHAEMKHVQAVQAEHAERLIRLERRQDDDARMKSVWGTSSPFPTLLGSSTPQQEPVLNPTADVFTSFDEERQNSLLGGLLGGLQLDQDGLPRRGASRANSVRFDESAIQAQWTQGSRSFGDSYPTRTSSGLGGHPMTERSSSYKSDGHSARHSSLGLDTTFPDPVDLASPHENPRPPPGLFILGPVPSIIRCWLDTNFSHETLLYAVLCTGSYKSYLNIRLIDRLGLKDQMRKDNSGEYRIKLPVYLPEAVVQQPSSRSSSPAPQLPTLTVDFTITDHCQDSPDTKAIEIFLGSDILRLHNADILLSQNTLTLFGDDHNKLSVPLVRPEDEKIFTGLYTTCTGPRAGSISTVFHTNTSINPPQQPAVRGELTSGPPIRKSLGTDANEHTGSRDQITLSASPVSSPAAMDFSESHATSSKEVIAQTGNGSGKTANVSSNSNASKALKISVPATECLKDEDSDHRPSEDSHSDWSHRERDLKADSVESGPCRDSSTGIWSSWRHEIGPDSKKDSKTGDSSTDGTGGSGYVRPGRGRSMKVLRPSKSVTSTSSRSYSASQSSPFIGANSPRSQDETKGKGPPSTDGSTDSYSWKTRRSASGDGPVTPSLTKPARTSSNKSRSPNPIGGASAFAWLNPNQQKQSTTTAE